MNCLLFNVDAGIVSQLNFCSCIIVLKFTYAIKKLQLSNGDETVLPK